MAAPHYKPGQSYTADDVWRLSQQDEHYELLRGELLEMAPASESHGVIAAEILRLVANFVQERQLGAVFAAETGFALVPDVVLAPDVAYIAKDRQKPPTQKFASVAPDLAVEVYSPNNTKAEMQEEVELFFKAGTRQMWIVFPRSRAIYVYRAADQVTILRGEEMLDDGDALPGFPVSVRELFSMLD